MPYITVRQPPPSHQLSFDELLLSTTQVELKPRYKRDASGTITRFVETPKQELLRRTDVQGMISLLESFVSKYADLYKKERRALYHTFYIPKHSGGLRKIDQPNEELMDALRELKRIFEDKIGALYHTSAFAYVSGRSTIDAIKRHQANESRWFLKTDFSNFFGSTTEDFLYRSISLTFPFSEIVRYVPGAKAFREALNLCMLDGGLPQGTPISPTLTNMMMIPFDHQVCNYLAKKGFVYTRYADDIQISHKFSFDYQEVVSYIKKVLSEMQAPFQIKDAKTRYGSSSGRNWNLGVMLNKDNQITVGYQTKKQFKAMVNNFIADQLNGVPWSVEDVRRMDGLKSYYLSVEREYFEHVIQHFNEKYKCDFKEMVSAVIRGN